MARPVDNHLYEAVKKEVYKRFKEHSAYRSGFLVREYKKAFAAKHGDNAKPYIDSNGGGLTRWFAEKWTNESGGIGYDSKNTLYRPTIRVSRETPKTWKEIPKDKIKSLRLQKKKQGRVSFM